MSHKPGSKTLSGEDELEVDVIDILGDDGLQVKGYEGTSLRAWRVSCLSE